MTHWKKNLYLVNGFKLLECRWCFRHLNCTRVKFFSKANKTILCIIRGKLIHQNIIPLLSTRNNQDSRQDTNFYLNWTLRWNFIINVNWTAQKKKKKKKTINCISKTNRKLNAKLLTIGERKIKDVTWCRKDTYLAIREAIHQW